MKKLLFLLLFQLHSYAATTLNPASVTVMADGRTIQIDFVGPIPKAYADPNWVNNLGVGSLQFSNGVQPEPIGIFTKHSDRATPYLYVVNANIPGTLAAGTYYLATTAYNPTTGVESLPSEILAFKFSSVGTSPSLTPLFVGTLPTSNVVNIYMGNSPTTMSLYRSGLTAAPNSTYYLSTNVWDNPTKLFPGQQNFHWYLHYFITNPNDVISTGTVLTASASNHGKVVTSDSYGNAANYFSDFPVTNNSLVDSSGFTAQFPVGTGGITLYVSNTYGSDKNTVLQAQSPATPLATPNQAVNLLKKNNYDKTGSHILLLRGDTWTGASGAIGLKLSGQDMFHPMIVGSYWSQYSGGPTSDPGTRPVIVSNQGINGNGGWTNNVIVRGLNVMADVNDTTTTPSGNEFVMGESSNITLDDNVFGPGFGVGFAFQGLNGQYGQVNFLHNIIIDSFATAGRPQGVFLYQTNQALFSGNILDRNGWLQNLWGVTDFDPNTAESNIFSHNSYFQWGTISILVNNYIHYGGAAGTEQRSGGITAYNVFSGNACQSMMAQSGTVHKNIYEGARDITDNPRGQNADFGGGVTEYGFSASDGLTFNRNIVVNNKQVMVPPYNAMAVTLSQDPAATVKRMMVNHNFFWNSGVPFILTGTLPANAEAINSQIIVEYNLGLSYADHGLNRPIFSLGPTNQPASWQQIFIPSNNYWYSTLKMPSISLNTEALISYTAWETSVGIKDNSVLTTVVTPDAYAIDLGTYAKSLTIGTTEQDFINLLRARPMGTYSPDYDIAFNVYPFFNKGTCFQSAPYGPCH